MTKLNRDIFIKNNAWLCIALLIAALLYAYYETFLSLMKIWSSRNDYAHGFIVPFASLYFVYALRNKLKAIEIKRNISIGMVATLAGVLMLVLGNTGGIITVQQLSILIVIYGLVIMLLGVKMFKALLLPLGYLVLMVPLILDVVFTPLHWPFQLFGAKIAANILGAYGIPVFHTAQYIELPNMPLEVANACSGIRYLVSITALAVPLAYLTLDTWPKRLFLIFSSLLIGVLANPLRIAIIGLWVYYGGSILHGPGHILQGYFVSVVGFGFLFTTAWIMNRKQTAGRNAVSIHPKRDRRGNDNARQTDYALTGKINLVRNPDYCIFKDRHSMRAWAYAISIILGAGIFVNAYSPVPVPLGSPKVKYSLALDGWEGHVLEKPAGEIATLPGTDVEIRVAYSSLSGDVIHLQVGYYEYQRQDKEFIHHTLQQLYEGAKPIRLEIDPVRAIEAKQVLFRGGGKIRLVTYWYEIGGCSTSSNITAKIIAALRGLILWKTNGAIVLIASELNETDSMENASRQQKKFAAAIYPFLKDYLNAY